MKKCDNYTSFLEKTFPPSLFDVAMHLLLHGVGEFDVYGLVHSWMYLMEWTMKSLKGYVCSMAWSKGSMVEY
jgi:hypothetical protein